MQNCYKYKPAMALLNDGVSGNLKYIFSCISHTNCNVND